MLCLWAIRAFLKARALPCPIPPPALTPYIASGSLAARIAVIALSACGWDKFRAG